MSMNIPPKSFDDIPNLKNYLKKASHRDSGINRVANLIKKNKGKCKYNKEKTEIQFIFHKPGKDPIIIPIGKIETNKSKFSLSHWAHKKRIGIDSKYKNKFNSGIDRIVSQLNPKKEPIPAKDAQKSSEESIKKSIRDPSPKIPDATPPKAAIPILFEREEIEKKVPWELKGLISHYLPFNTKKDIASSIELMKVLYRAKDGEESIYGSIDPKELGAWISVNKIPLGKLPLLSQKEQIALLPHLTYLDLKGSPRYDFDLIKNYGKQLETLIVNEFVTGANFIGINEEWFPCLTTLALRACPNLYDEELKYITSLTKLTSLNLAAIPSITDKGLDGLQSLTRLTSLDLSYCGSLTDSGIGKLKSLSGLTSLNLYDCHLTDSCLEEFKSLKGLKSLNLGACSRLTDQGLKHLEVLKEIVSLDLSYCYRLTDEGLKSVGALENLTSLSLVHGQFSDGGLGHLKDNASLTSLNLQGCRGLRDRGLKPLLESLTGLTVLDISGCTQVTDKGLEGLQGLTKLTDLSLGLSRWTDEVLQHLTHLPLTSLDLSGSDLSDDGLQHLSSLSQLTSLNLSYCRGVTGNGLKALAGLPLTFLDLSVTSVIPDSPDIGFQPLASLHKLTSLRLNNCDELTDDELQRSIAPLKGLTSLSLAGNDQLTDKGLQHLSSLSQLTYLDLSDCHKLTAEGKRPFEKIREK